ncbi:hypothetical protein [Aquirhabdus parva]|uniref:Uncharacterized protein n=1 Tax=Aquirhabdus parva TaxID=2283318 RepID=A0A345PAT4_9GAMM|nr:hypothetical protein [Aquirhabdus parva]AXI04349.1 hypothetical protein HYN46_16805 [Aquirhabdus parva]AXI04393.1 hypothetical protein HYN46_17050 [Aquirhabdus parva]
MSNPLEQQRFEAWFKTTTAYEKLATFYSNVFKKAKNIGAVYIAHETKLAFEAWQAAKLDSIIVESEWVNIADRLPTEADTDECGYLWAITENYPNTAIWYLNVQYEKGLWHPKPKCFPPKPPVGCES